MKHQNISVTGSLNLNGVGVATTSTLNAFTASSDTKVNALIANTGSYATTGSNTFTGSQIIQGTLTAQTLVVQTVTSSVLFSTGSNKLGSSLSNTQELTGSVGITGSLSVVTTGTEFQVNAGGVNIGNALTDNHIISGSVTINPNGLFVSSSGVVGIGTTSPAASRKLTVAGGAQLTYGDNSGASFNIVPGATGQAGADLNLSYYTGTDFGPLTFTLGGSERIRITSIGNLVINASGIPSLSTGQIVNKQKSDSTTPYLNGIVNMAASNSSTLTIYYDGSVHNIAASYYTGGDGGAFKPMAFLTGDVERMRITSGGYTKITNDGTYLNSVGTYHEIKTSLTNNVAAYIINSAASPYGAGIVFSSAAPNNGTNYFLSCSDTVNTKIELRSNGGIANYSANDVNLSDIRTKKDIIPLGSYWDKFKAIEIVKFKYKDQNHDDYNIGVIAQQIEQVAPEFVDVDGWGETPEDGIPLKSIYTADLYHATIKVLQETMARIEALENEIDILKNK